MRRGVALVVTALSLVVILPMVGLGIDGATLYFIRARLSQAADAAALAGARSLSRGADINSQRTNATDVANKYYAANFPSGFWGTTNRAASITVGQDDVTRVRWVTVTASVDAPLYFMQIVNRQSAHIQITAQSRRRDVNVMLVLDRSGSMVDGNAIVPMQAAANAFVDNFAVGRDKLGLLTFGGNSFLAAAPTVNFKSGLTDVPLLINTIVGGGNTNTSQALWQAYQQLVGLAEPGALNVIVLFTDGRPTAFTGLFNQFKSTSTCTNLTTKRGFIADQNAGRDPGATAGIFVADATGLPDVAETLIVPNNLGCRFAISPQNMRQDLQSMPSQDAYGNATTQGYQPVDLTRVDLPSQIEAASENAADSAARRIRGDASLAPVIYVIGLGGNSIWPPDEVLMKRIANDSESAIYDASKPTGLYVWSPSTVQLRSAFIRIASEILRLAQ